MTDPANNTLASTQALPSTESPGAGKRPSIGRRWRRPILVGGFGIAAVVLGAAAWFYYRGYVAEQALREAIAEADRLDPGWRLDELECRRPPVPDGQNAATLVNNAGRKLIPALNTGTNRDKFSKIDKELESLALTARLTERQTAALRAALTPLAGPLADARRVADFPRGRYPFSTTPALNYTLPHVDHAGLCVWLLGKDVRLRIQDKDLDGAWVGCRAILNFARSFGDEPEWVPQTVRAVHVIDAIRMMERTLAQGDVPESALADIQKLLQEELTHPGLLIALRGGRAHWHFGLTQVEAGKYSAAELNQLAARKWQAPGIKEEVEGFLSRSKVKPTHAWLLRYYTQAIEIAKQPGPGTEDSLRELQATLADAPELARQLAPKFDARGSLVSNQSKALTGCACAALAAERYRLKHKRWPGTLADLVASGFLVDVPADPYDGAPLRFRRLSDGIVIYSSRDTPARDGRRLEFRLWDVEKR